MEEKLAWLRFVDAKSLNVVRRLRRKEGDYWFAPEATGVLALTFIGPFPAGVLHLCMTCGSPDAFKGLVSL